MTGVVERATHVLGSSPDEGLEELLLQPSAPPISLLEEVTDAAQDVEAPAICSTDTRSLWRAARQGLIPGAVFGSAIALSRARNFGLKFFQIFPAIAFATVKCSTASGIFLGLEQKLKQIRGVQDILNAMLAGGSAMAWLVALNAFRPFIYSDKLLRIIDNKVSAKTSFQNVLAMFALGSTLGGVVHILKYSLDSEAIEPPPSTPLEARSRDAGVGGYDVEKDSRTNTDDS